MSPNSNSHTPSSTSGMRGNLKTIDLEFATVREFRATMASRLNYEGFFVATNDPLPKGTPVRFRFLLADGFVLVEGTAVVTWSRYENGGPDQRYGMALLFNELEDQGREIIDELIDYHIATGGDPFEIGPGISDAGDIGTDALASDPLETKVPLPELDPSLDATEDGDEAPDDVLPDWLSAVAEKHDIDLSPEATKPVGLSREVSQDPEGQELTQQEFEVSLMPEGEDLDPTPAIVGDGAAPEITVRSSDDLEVPRDLRLKPLLAVVAVIVVAAATVWWVANRGPRGTVSEPTVVVEDLPAPEPSQEALGKPAQEPAGKPLEVSEAKLESPPVREMPKPAARILDVEVSAITDETLLTVRANGVLSLDSIRVARLKDPARVWVRIQGIETFYRPNLIEVGTTEVERVRIGHHPEETPQSLYVVLDLADSASGVRDYTVEGDTLRVAVGRPEQ